MRIVCLFKSNQERACNKPQSDFRLWKKRRMLFRFCLRPNRKRPPCYPKMTRFVLAVIRMTWARFRGLALCELGVRWRQFCVAFRGRALRHTSEYRRPSTGIISGNESPVRVQFTMPTQSPSGFENESVCRHSSLKVSCTG